MEKLTNAGHAAILRALSFARAQTRAGKISSYDPNTYKVKVEISPELIVTGWLPLLALWVGNGFGFYVGPAIGDQVIVIHLEDDLESGMALLYCNDDDHVPPPVPSGEMWAVHKSTSSLKFTNDGKVAISSNSDMDLTVKGNLNANATGDANIIAGGAVNIGGTGGEFVARNGDPVVGGVIQATSTKVKSI